MGFGEWYVYDWQSGSDIGGAEGQWGDDGDNFVSGEVVIINWSKLKCIKYLEKSIHTVHALFVHVGPQLSSQKDYHISGPSCCNNAPTLVSL